MKLCDFSRRLKSIQLKTILDIKYFPPIFWMPLVGALILMCHQYGTLELGHERETRPEIKLTKRAETL